MSRSIKKTSSEIDRAIRQTSQLRKLILSLKDAKKKSDEDKKRKSR